MPTGYTIFIENGKVTTGADFLKICIRNFGCCINQRDDPLDDPLITDIKPSKYYKEQYEYELAKLETIRKKSRDEIKDELRIENENRMNQKKKFLNDQVLLRNKYLNVLKDVEAWNPPTPDHEPIKQFALEQIDTCMPSIYQLKQIEEEIQRLEKESIDISDEAVTDYIVNEIAFYSKELKRLKEHMENEKELAANRTKFIKDFLSSLN